MEALIFLILAALTIIPLMKLLPLFDLNPWWALVVIVPLGLIVLLWIMAARIDRLKGGTADGR